MANHEWQVTKIEGHSANVQLLMARTRRQQWARAIARAIEQIRRASAQHDAQAELHAQDDLQFYRRQYQTCEQFIAQRQSAVD